jgi:hypothetical protein
MSEERRTFTAAQLHACLEREIRQRKRVYPRWVEERRFTQSFADEQIAMMEAIAEDYRLKAEAERAKGDLFGGQS